MNNPRALRRHKPFLTPIWLTGIMAACAFLCALLVLWVWATADATTVIVIRHAEKSTEDPTDPILSEQGAARAQRLAQIFVSDKMGRLSAIYVSDTKRSKLTAAPLAMELGLTPQVLPAGDAKTWVRHALHDHSGGRVLLVTHLDTLPTIVAELSGEAAPTLSDTEFGAMYVVTVPRIGHANLLSLHY